MTNTVLALPWLRVDWCAPRKTGESQPHRDTIALSLGPNVSLPPTDYEGSEREREGKRERREAVRRARQRGYGSGVVGRDREITWREEGESKGTRRVRERETRKERVSKASRSSRVPEGRTNRGTLCVYAAICPLRQTEGVETVEKNTR